MRVTLLGTGMPRPDFCHFGPAALVQAGGEMLLFDAGRGATLRLQQLGISPGRITQVFLTHLHSDHVVGLPDLWLTGWIWQRPAALAVSGPRGTVALTRHLSEAFAFDIHARRDQPAGLDPAGVAFAARDIAPGVVYRSGGVEVEAFAVDHGHVKPAFGYRVTYGRRVVVISGDTRFSDNLVRHARGADLLVHEVAAVPVYLLADNPRLRAVMRYHSSPEEAARVFQLTRPALAVFTHRVLLGGAAPDSVLARARKGYKGPIVLGEDLMQIDIGERIAVRTDARMAACRDPVAAIGTPDCGDGCRSFPRASR